MFKFFIALLLWSAVLQAQDLGCPSQFIVWNIGQGQWTTEVHPEYCLHYDLGGEVDVTALAVKLCSHRPNFLFLSHWDQDHIGYAAHYAATVGSACLFKLPVGQAPSHRKIQMIKKIPLCQPQDFQLATSLTLGIYDPIFSPQMTSNDLSRVVYSKAFQILLPGDSTKKEEKKWAVDAPSKTWGLVLGHHGSRTSTSPLLMTQLPNLKWAVSSARKKRYGHPHKEVVELLKKEKVPLLKTEDWGHLHFFKDQTTDDKVCIPYPNHEPLAHSKPIRRRHSDP